MNYNAEVEKRRWALIKIQILMLYFTHKILFILLILVFVDQSKWKQEQELSCSLCAAWLAFRDFVAPFFEFSSYSCVVNLVSGMCEQFISIVKLSVHGDVVEVRFIARVIGVGSSGDGWVLLVCSVSISSTLLVGATASIKAILLLQSARLVMCDITLGVSAANRVY